MRGSLALYVRGTKTLLPQKPALQSVISGGYFSATNEESGDIDTRGRNALVTALYVRGTEFAAPSSRHRKGREAVAKAGFRDGVQNWALLLLRVGAGLMLALLHGWSKVQGAYGMVVDGEAWRHVDTVTKIGLPAPKLLAVCSALAEFVGGILLAAGLLTPLAAAAVAINMGVAVGLHLSGDMRLELAAMYLLVAVYLLVRGGGRFSVDQGIWRK